MKIRYKLLVIFIGGLLLFPLLSPSIAATADQSTENITAAKNQLNNCYKTALDSESASANITALAAILNQAETDLYNAESSNNAGNYELAVYYSNQCMDKLANFSSQADILKQNGTNQRNLNNAILTGSIIGVFLVAIIMYAIWLQIKKMNLANQEIKKILNILIIVSIIISLFLASPALQQITVPGRTINYSEISLISPSNNFTYPYEINNDENYTVSLEITNHMGYLEHYVVQIKLNTLAYPNSSSLNSKPLNMPALLNVTKFVPNESTLQTPFTFSLSYAINDSTVNFTGLQFNNNRINLTGYSTNYRIEQPIGFFENLYFELWTYNSSTNQLDYANRFVNLPLKITA